MISRHNYETSAVLESNIVKPHTKILSLKIHVISSPTTQLDFCVLNCKLQQWVSRLFVWGERVSCSHYFVGAFNTTRDCKFGEIIYLVGLRGASAAHTTQPVWKTNKNIVHSSRAACLFTVAGMISSIVPQQASRTEQHAKNTTQKPETTSRTEISIN